MKNFLSTVKGKVIAGAVTLAVIAAAIIVIVLLNTGYRTISVDDLTGVTTITAGKSVSEAFKGQNLKSGSYVFVEEASDLTLALDTDKHVYAGEFTGFSLEAAGKPGKDSRTVIRLDEGSVLSEIDEKLSTDESYVVESPNATMAVRGTIFTVSVNYDEEGLCHTLVEVEEGTVEVTEKDENGDPTDEVQTLEAGGKTEVISLVINRNDEDDNPGGGDFPPDNDLPPEDMEFVYQDPEALAVEAALETFLNGGELDTANFDRVTDLEIYGRVAFVTLDHLYVGRTQSPGWDATNDEIDSVSYMSDSGEEIEIPTSNSSLTDLNFLTGMKNLEGLKIYFGNVTDISPLENLTELTTLLLEHNHISDISSINRLENLWCLSFSHNDISNLPQINGLNNLYSLDLSYNDISDLPPISGLKDLKCLVLQNNNISDLSPINSLSGLDELSISKNNISDLSPISELTNLERLFIDYNNISDLSPVSGLTELGELSVRENDVSDLSPISMMNNLMSLNLEDNPINDFSPLYGLTNLHHIHFDDDDISDDELAKLQQALPGASIYN